MTNVFVYYECTVWVPYTYSTQRRLAATSICRNEIGGRFISIHSFIRYDTYKKREMQMKINVDFTSTYHYHYHTL